MEKPASVERPLEAHGPGLGNGYATNSAQKRLNWRHVAVGVCFSVIWSSAFVAGKIVVTEMGPFVSLFYRFVGTVFVLGLLCGKSLWGPQAGRVLRAGFVLGLLNNVAYLGLSFSALQLVSPPWVVVIVSCSPFATLMLGVARRLESFSAAKLLGFGLSLAGIVLMVGVSKLEAGAVQGLLLAAGATVAFSVGAVLFRGRYCRSISGCQSAPCFVLPQLPCRAA